MDFLQNVFCSVFFTLIAEKHPATHKTKKIEQKLTSKFLPIFLGKVFDMDFLQKYVCGVFDLPYRETPKSY
jgi:hypothetical protein